LVQTVIDVITGYISIQSRRYWFKQL